MNTKELIKAVKNERGSAFQNCNDCEYGTHNGEVIEKLNRLAEFEDTIEKGTLIELPCKVGDTCYLVYEGLGNMCRVEYKIKEVKIDNIHYIGDNEFFTEMGEYSCYTVKFGKEIFSTREEAEKRLKELQK